MSGFAGSLQKVVNKAALGYPSSTKCDHCERAMNNFAGGSSRGYNNEQLCHPNVGNRPDCYALVTRYGHPTPCDRVSCYEEHENFMDYVNGK